MLALGHLTDAIMAIASRSVKVSILSSSSLSVLESVVVVSYNSPEQMSAALMW